jgi:inorganic pyrophosphatase
MNSNKKQLLIRAIIESPKGSMQKFDLDQHSGKFVLSKQLPQGMSFPFDFGFIPNTIGQDGDPLDVVVIGEHPTFTGCAVDCRIIGSLVCEQTERDGKKLRNDRYLAVSNVAVSYDQITDLKKLPKEILSDIESFFITYNSLAGKELKVSRRTGPARSHAAINAAKTDQHTNIRLELFLPVSKNDGGNFPDSHYSDLEKELTERFGGVTIYSRGAVEGKWKAKGASTSEPMVVYEVLLSELEKTYWTTLKKRLEKKFSQKEIMVFHSPVMRVRA